MNDGLQKWQTSPINKVKNFFTKYPRIPKGLKEQVVRSKDRKTSGTKKAFNMS
jgi:hypothetical protein